MARLDHPIAIVLGAVTFTVATLGINVVANFVSPAYDLANAWPSKINFQRGGVISACIALVMTPWNLFNSPFIINVFLAALGAVLGPLFGIIIADYFILRRQQVQVSELFKSQGTHSFNNGWNMRAVWAFIIASIPSILVAVVQVDFCKFLSPFSWFIGAASASSSTWRSPATTPTSSRRWSRRRPWTSTPTATRSRAEASRTHVRRTEP